MAARALRATASFLIWADDRHLVPDGAGIDFTAAFFKQGASGGGVNVERVADIPVGGPMVAVGRRPDPRLWSALSYAPLRELAAAYAAASAEILEHTGNRYSYTHVGQAKGAVQ